MSAKRLTGWRLTTAGVAALLATTGVALVIAGAGPSGSSTSESTALPADVPAAAEAGAPSADAPGAAAATGVQPKPNGSKPKRPVPKADRPSPKKAAEQAKATVVEHPGIVRGVAGEEYRSRTALVDEDGSRHVRFDRLYRGLTVLGGDFLVHSGPDGELLDTTLSQAAPITVSVKPEVSAAAAAKAAAAKHTGKQSRTAPALVVDAGDGEPRLAWQVVVENPASGATTVVVDAKTGGVRRSYDNVRTEAGTGHGNHSGKVELSTTRRADGTFELIDPDRGNTETRDAVGTPAGTRPTKQTSRSYIDDDNVWGDASAHSAAAAVDVHYGTRQVSDYLQQVHGRNGLRDDGKGPIAYLRDGYDNASWSDSCFCMQFESGAPGKPSMTSLDTVAHEMAHGLSGATANLTYSGESGGIDEANSDIFGALVEFHADNPADPPDYLVGEQDNSVTEPLRFMDDPAKDGVSLSCWTPALKNKDVHYSSGVGNKFFYTLAVGSGKSKWGDSPTCNGAPGVTGIGNDKAGQIWYRALTRYMVSYTNYSAAREATLKAAADLYGADGVEHKAVDAAWKAVAVDGSDPVATDPVGIPLLLRPDPAFGVVGKPFLLNLHALDRQGDPLTFGATGLPAGLALTPATGRISGTPTVATALTIVDISVRDPAGNTATAWFAMSIFPPLAVTNPGPQTAVVDRPVRMKLQSSHERMGPRVTAVGLPPGLTIYDHTISGTPTTAGTTTAVVTFSDEAGQQASVTFAWRVYAKAEDLPSTEPTAPSSGGPSNPPTQPGPGSNPATSSPTASASPSAPGPGTGGPATESATPQPVSAGGPLASTGTDVVTLAGVGALLVAAGLALLSMGGRRRATPQS